MKSFVFIRIFYSIQRNIRVHTNKFCTTVGLLAHKGKILI